MPVLRYRDARIAVDFLVEAFGFAEHAIFEEDGIIVHGQLAFGTGMVMVGTAHGDDPPPGSVYVVVDDVAAHHARAVAAGAVITSPPTEQDYGGSSYTAVDPEGNVWSFGDYEPAAST
jgi:uncharacterized glyoxalase superfamily protein PhnB